MSRDGRESQSIAFFSMPGMELLYSGVTSRSPVAAAIASFRRATGAEIPRSLSTSPSYRGSSAMETTSTSVPVGASSRAARRSAAL
jgi:hypothetical protein